MVWNENYLITCEIEKRRKCLMSYCLQNFILLVQEHAWSIRNFKLRFLIKLAS